MTYAERNADNDLVEQKVMGGGGFGPVSSASLTVLLLRTKSFHYIALIACLLARIVVFVLPSNTNLCHSV